MMVRNRAEAAALADACLEARTSQSEGMRWLGR